MDLAGVEVERWLRYPEVARGIALRGGAMGWTRPGVARYLRRRAVAMGLRRRAAARDW